jgi:hypothetical protein
MFTFEKPPTWNNWPLYKKINYYKGILTKDYACYVDKIEAKVIVSRMTNDNIKCAKLIRILESPEDFHEADLNTNHIIKSAHGCGWNINIDETTTVDNVRNTLQSWNCPYVGNNEHHYQYIKPRFFIEEKINDSLLGQTAKANVYLIRCIHGQPFAIGVRTELGQNSYDLSGNAIKEIEIQTGKPKHLSKMLEYAELLSAPFEFVRIDFYIGADDHIYFSEFTFTPSGGNSFYSMKYEKLFGQLWT